MVEEPRYAFNPLERRGLLLGLDGAQLLTLAGAAVVALATRAVVGGTVGGLSALVVAAGGVAAAVWTKDGRPMGTRMVAAAAWAVRRAGGPTVDEAPTRGRMTAGGIGASTRVASTRPPTRPGGIDLVEDAGLPGEDPLGVVRDDRGGTWAAVVPVRGCSFALLDPPAQAQRLEGWRRVLGSVARAGSPVVRVQWVQRSWVGPADPSDGTPDRIGHGRGEPAPGPACTSYRELLEASLPAMAHHRAWLVIVVRPTHQPLHGLPASARALTELRRELRLLHGQLTAAELDPQRPLALPGLARLLEGPARTHPARAAGPWPLAAEDGWSAYRADGEWHATYWIAEWPRLEVGPAFLSPLLLGPARTTVSVLMAPVPPDRAMREARSARTADLADAELRARAGFLPSARREREQEGVVRREEELAEGHQEFRFSGYVTVSAADPDELAAAGAAIEHAAQSARLELRRLFGRQAEAYSWTLPLGRGLR